MKQSVLIIGGGILGATSSYYLARAGFDVTVLEKAELCSAASGANLGQISLMDRDEAWHAKASLDSLAVYEELSKAMDLEYEQSGGCAVIMNQEQLDAVLEAQKNIAEFGIEVRLVQGEDVLRYEPALDYTKIIGIAHCPGEGKINPLLTTIAFFDMAKSLGVKVLEHTPVTGFVIENSRIAKVLSNDKEFKADFIINAAGAWAGHIAQMAGITIPLHYHRGTAYVTQPVAPVIRGPIVGGGLFLTGMGGMSVKRHIGLAAIQTKHGSVIIAQSTELTDVDDKEVSVQGLCLTARRFVEVFPSLAGLEVVRAWSAVTPYTDDHRPVFGFSGKVTNLFTVAGFKGAFTTAPAVGMKVAEAIKDGFIWEGNAFSPDRNV